MKVSKRLLLLMSIFVLSTVFLIYQTTNVRILSLERNPAKVSVFLSDFNDDLISEIRKNLEEIQKKNSDKVEYNFYDGKLNQKNQNEEIAKVLEERTDLILLNIVDRAYSKAVIDKIKANNVPVILFNREPLTSVPIQSYGRAIYIGTDPVQAGILQGEMLIDLWNSNKKYIDRNNDGILQYYMLEGEGDNTEATERTKYVISTIEKSGIKTQQVGIDFADWSEKAAYEHTKEAFEKYSLDIDVIIANDDSMAIGAVKALQEYGYNKGEKSKTIPVVGVDVIPKAKEFIEKGYMLGSVYQDPKDYAKALYEVGMNLINYKDPVADTKYTLDNTKVSIRIPHTNYFYNNIFDK